MARKYLVSSIVGSLIFAAASCCPGMTPDDHLVPFSSAFGIDTSYDKLVRRKLFVARGEIARMVQIPGYWGVERVISVHRCDSKRNQFCVTIAEPPQMLWPFARDKKVPTHIKVQKCEASLPAAAARAIEKTWSAMIGDARPEANSDEIMFEGMRAQFYVIDPTGRESGAELPKQVGKKTAALLELGNLLITYCSLPPSMRPNNRKRSKQGLHLF